MPALALLSPLALAGAGDRWVNATSLLLRAEASPTAAVLARLQQGSRVRLVTPAVGGGDWCMVEAGARLAFVACRYLSEQPVALPRACEGGVPADQRWVGGSQLLLRAQPRADAAVLARLPLNAPLRLSGPDAGAGYCPVQLLEGQALSGYTACRYLQAAPLDLDGLSRPQLADGGDNPDFDPARAFWIQPDWGLMAHYARRVAQQREAQGEAAPRGPDEQLERMKARLSGELLTETEAPTVWPAWDDLRQGPADGASAALALWSEAFMEAGGRRVAAFVRAVPALPPAAPSWWRSEVELAGPAESPAALASRFGAQVQRLHESLQPGSPHRGEVAPGTRLDRLTRPLHRISLTAGEQLHDELRRPELAADEWDPTRDYNCPGWQPGFSHGQADAATYRRNGFELPATRGPATLFRFWSSRPLPAGPARWTRQTAVLDREATGFVRAELRSVDLDGDGIADLVWLQATGRGPGHLEGPPAHDDPWFRALLANVAGRWRLLAVDSFSYGCGC